MKPARCFQLFVILWYYASLSSANSYTSSSSSWFSTPSSPTKKRGSFFKINPKSIISTVCKYGSIVLPDTVEKDLKVIEQTCDCDETSLDLINRNLEILNFTVSVPGKGKHYEPALRVRRINIIWDSYIKPCLEIEVDGVDILVEFVNILLTRNNWYVAKAGFTCSLQHLS